MMRVPIPGVAMTAVVVGLIAVLQSLASDLPAFHEWWVPFVLIGVDAVVKMLELALEGQRASGYRSVDAPPAPSRLARFLWV